MLRILTANLFNGRSDAEAFGKLLDEKQPDVVAAQELAPSAAAVIARRMPHGLILPALDHSGSALAARVPMAVRRVTLPHRDALVGDIDEGRLTIFSIHLANPLDRHLPVGTRRAQVIRLEEALHSALDGGGRLVAVGDLNATPLWPAYRRLTARLADGVADWAKSRGRRPERTWGYRPGGRAWLRIDHVLTAGVKVANVETLVVAGSDHRALLVDLA